jgi:OmcA/MtrC family decaheme c-type cytochrome
MHIFSAVPKALRIVLGLAVLLSAVTVNGQTKAAFGKRDKAYYLNQNQVEFIRPGLAIKIVSAQIASDGTIQATFTISDPKGMALDMAGVDTPGPVSVSFLAAYIPAGQKQYVAYNTQVAKATLNSNTATQATTDKGGVFAKVADGKYTYTFKTKLPAGYDASATHSIGAYATRNLAEFNLGSYGKDDVYTFVPNGAPVTVVRNIIDTATCNKCHDPISAHGGARQKIEMCDLCHTPQTSNPDTLLTMDMPVLIHKIHMGKDLPSVVAGGKYQIFHRGAWSDFSDVGFPTDQRNCEVCHQPGTKQADAWLQPSRAACGSCHDNVNFASGENHVNLPQVSDNQCHNCHQPDGDEFDTSIKGAHTVPTQSKALTGVVFKILKVDAAAGSKPTVTFTVKDNSGKPLLPSDLTRLNIVIAGPNSDYSGYVSESALKAPATTEGTYTYTMAYVIPATATGSYTIGIEGRKDAVLMAGTVKQQTVRDLGKNVSFSFSVDGSPVASRRQIVDTEKCNSCHYKIGLHGGNRNAVEQCVLCHNPNQTDTQKPAEAIDFRTMVHKIHTGKSLTNTYQIGSAKFNEVGYPGDRRNCDTCHVNGSQQLPLKDDLLSVTTPRGYTTTTPPTAAACQGCHDNKSTAAHALSNTNVIGESCATCHGPSAEFSVDQVHAR